MSPKVSLHGTFISKHTKAVVCVFIRATINDLRVIILNGFLRWLLVGYRGFSRGCLSKQTQSWHVWVAHFQWRHLVCEVPKVTRGQTKERSWTGGAVHVLIWENSIKHHIHPSFHGNGADTNTVAFFPPAVSPCGNCGGFTGKTNARSCVLSEPAATVARSPKPRRAAIQQLNGAG